MSNSQVPRKIHLDDTTRAFRLINPDEHHLARRILALVEEMQDECAGFTRHIKEIYSLLDQMGSLVRTAKSEVIGKRCLLFVAKNERKAEQKSYQEEMFEKTAQVDRNDLYIQSLNRQETEQTDLLTRIFRK